MIHDKEIQRRLKISQTLKGRVPWNKGLKNWRVISEETRRKIGLAHKGKIVIVSEETKRKISETMKGIKPSNLQTLHILPRTKEWRKNMSLSQKGKKLSEETKRKISEAKRNPLTPLHRAIRECYKYGKWRTTIFKRDNYVCQICKKRGGTLHADHIKSFVSILKENKIETLNQALKCDELWDIKNGRLLCIECHRKTPTWGNKKTG